ncbi:MAG: hypothetical protein EXS05_17535 [Planctomycetaceae bacterium]|nr:hypothetical protein [Planctomycetaceae bacterium]
MRRLEDRRVLDGAAVVPPPVEVTESDAGAVVVNVGPADGAADVFKVIRSEADGKDLLQVTINGSVVFSEDLDQVASITINGTTDQETLVVDFGDGNPIPVGGINFVGASDASALGQADAVMFVNGAVDSVAYAFSGTTDGSISLTTGGTTSTIELSASVQTVTDLLSATTRSFTFGGTITQAELSVNTSTDLNQVTLTGGSQIEFANPTQSLSLADATTAGLALTVDGLASQFQSSLSIAGGAATQVLFSGPTSVGTGNVTVAAGSVSVSSNVSTLGGTIEFTALESVAVTSAGQLSSPGGIIRLSAPTIQVDGAVVAADGGQIRLDAGPQGTLLVSGRIDASAAGSAQIGGTVDLLGGRIGLIGYSVVDVSGGAGGGKVRIGGDWGGASAGAPNSLQTYVGSGTTIRADALVSGNGGTVVVWSDETTLFYGQISARGGAQAGAGGNAEISSAAELLYQGQTDLTAASGSTGTLLLDPRKITIVDQSDGANDDQLNPDVILPGDPAGQIFFNNLKNANFDVSDRTVTRPGIARNFGISWRK